MEQEEEKTFAADDEQASPNPTALDRQLKMRGDIILFPQPSDDTADPLVRTSSPSFLPWLMHDDLYSMYADGRDFNSRTGGSVKSTCF
jgi:hypothetical protein